MAKRPDWAMKSWTAVNINEFILLDMFGSPCRMVVMFSKFAGSLHVSHNDFQMYQRLHTQRVAHSVIRHHIH